MASGARAITAMAAPITMHASRPMTMAESATEDAPKRAGVIKSGGRVGRATEPSLNLQKSMIKFYADTLLKKINQQ